MEYKSAEYFMVKTNFQWNEIEYGDITCYLGIRF